jgi:hypothetical protein
MLHQRCKADYTSSGVARIIVYSHTYDFSDVSRLRQISGSDWVKMFHDCNRNNVKQEYVQWEAAEVLQAHLWDINRFSPLPVLMLEDHSFHNSIHVSDLLRLLREEPVKPLVNRLHDIGQNRRGLRESAPSLDSIRVANETTGNPLILAGGSGVWESEGSEHATHDRTSSKKGHGSEPGKLLAGYSNDTRMSTKRTYSPLSVW